MAEEKKPGKKKNKSLEILRAVTKSLAHGIVPDDELADEVDEGLARVGGGLASQYFGVDEEGNAQDALTANLRRLWNADERRRRGLPPEKRVLPGLITDTLSIPNMFGNGPEWSQRMSEEADATHNTIGEDLDLPETSGFVDHALDAGGMMLGQVPLWLASAPKKAQEGVGALQKMKNFGKAAAVSPVEFFMPTIEPSALNYLMGAGFGGALGALGDEVPEEVIEEPRVHKAKGGKVGTFNRVVDAIRSRYPKPGVFSVLDNLIEQAPFEKATPDQWKAYLKPGREYVREDVRFPLRKDELKWGGEQFDVLMNSVRHDNPSVTKEELLGALRKGRPEFSSTTYGGAQEDAMREFSTWDMEQNQGFDPRIGAIHTNIYDDPQPRFGNPSWRSSGGDNYHEWVTGIPTRDIHTPDYEGGHFSPDTISWSRIQDIYEEPRVDIGGEEFLPNRGSKVRLVDEIQSDLHQAATFKFPGDRGRLGYASDPTKALTEDEIREYLIPEIESRALEVFQQRYGHLPDGPRDPDFLDDIRDELLDHIPPQGQPVETPFMEDAWIRHELQKNLLEAAEQGDEGLAVIHPENIKSRYTENPGLGKFYEVSVVPELERLARRYGAEMGVSGKEVKPVADSWMRAVHSLNNIDIDDAMDDEGFVRAARLALDEIEASGYDVDNLPMISRDILEDWAEGDRAIYGDPGALRSAIAIARNTIQRDLSRKSFDKTQVQNPTLKLTPELREKIKRIGVPLYSLPFFLGGDDEVEGFSEGGKASAAKGALRLFRGLTGGKDGISEKALKGLPRDEYSTFMSTSPHVASSYANPNFKFSETGAVAPFYVDPKKVIEFPVNPDGTFNKVDFDRRARQLKKGEVLVARNAYDSGPRASIETDPERLYSYRSDIYAVGPGVKMKTGIGEGYAEGGKVGALQKALEVLAIDRRARARNIQKADTTDPIKTVQESMEGLPPEDREAINSMLMSNDEDQVLEALLMLHGKYFPYPIKPEPSPPPSTDAKMGVHGSMSNEEWERKVLGLKKSRGGRIRRRNR